MAHFSTAGPLCLLWFAVQLSVAIPFSLGSRQNLVPSLTASQPEEEFDLGRFQRLAEDLSLTSSSYHSSLAYRVGYLTSGYLQEEPDAGKPHVRICEGESRMAELLDRVVPYCFSVHIANRTGRPSIGHWNSADYDPEDGERVLGTATVLHR
jgi:hypothetical protein